MFKLFLNNEKGEAYVGQAVKIVIAIVLGAALLAGCVLVFNEVILPNVEYAMEWGFGHADEKVDDIEESGTYKSFTDYMNALVKEEVGALTDEEVQETCDDINNNYPECAPPGGLTPTNIQDGETYLCVAYSLNEGVTYQEAYNMTKTKEGRAILMEYVGYEG